MDQIQISPKWPNCEYSDQTQKKKQRKALTNNCNEKPKNPKQFDYLTQKNYEFPKVLN